MSWEEGRERSSDRDSLLLLHTTTSDAKCPLEAADVAVLGRGNERVEKTSLLGRIRRHPAAIRDVLASASHHLPRVGGLKPKDVPDLTVWIVERLSKDVGGTLRRRQLLQQQQDSRLQTLASLRFRRRVGTRVDWFRKLPRQADSSIGD